MGCEGASGPTAQGQGLESAPRRTHPPLYSGGDGSGLGADGPVYGNLHSWRWPLQQPPAGSHGVPLADPHRGRGAARRLLFHSRGPDTAQLTRSLQGHSPCPPGKAPASHCCGLQEVGDPLILPPRLLPLQTRAGLALPRGARESPLPLDEDPPWSRRRCVRCRGPTPPPGLNLADRAPARSGMPRCTCQWTPPGRAGTQCKLRPRRGLGQPRPLRDSDLFPWRGLGQPFASRKH